MNIHCPIINSWNLKERANRYRYGEKFVFRVDINI